MLLPSGTRFSNGTYANVGWNALNTAQVPDGTRHYHGDVPGTCRGHLSILTLRRHCFPFYLLRQCVYDRRSSILNTYYGRRAAYTPPHSHPTPSVSPSLLNHECSFLPLVRMGRQSFYYSTPYSTFPSPVVNPPVSGYAPILHKVTLSSDTGAYPVPDYGSVLPFGLVVKFMPSTLRGLSPSPVSLPSFPPPPLRWPSPHLTLRSSLPLLVLSLMCSLRRFLRHYRPTLSSPWTARISMTIRPCLLTLMNCTSISLSSILRTSRSPMLRRRRYIRQRSR